MIGFKTDDACSHCPLTLVCWGDGFKPEMLESVTGRFCLYCGAFYFNDSGETYVCQRYQEQGATGESLLVIIKRQAESRSGTQYPIISACAKNLSCLEFYRDAFSCIY